MIDQARKDGFRFRNIDELAQLRIAAAESFPTTVLATEGALPSALEKQMFDHKEHVRKSDIPDRVESTDDKKGSVESV